MRSCVFPFHSNFVQIAIERGIENKFLRRRMRVILSCSQCYHTKLTHTNHIACIACTYFLDIGLFRFVSVYLCEIFAMNLFTFAKFSSSQFLMLSHRNYHFKFPKWLPFAVAASSIIAIRFHLLRFDYPLIEVESKGELGNNAEALNIV